MGQPGETIPPEVVAVLRADPARTVLAFDFDGTLAPVVPLPADARPAPGVVERLDQLARSYQQVLVVSGRPVAFLAEHLPPSVQLVGLYGLERRIDGVISDHEEAPSWRPVVARAAAEARRAAQPGRALDGLVVEPKGLSITLHVRIRPDLEPAAGELARRLADETGLEVRAAKRSFELHPPVAVDKGTALLEFASGAATVAFVGDDLGDLPAFDALDELGRAGCQTVGVVVGGDELPEALRRRGQVVLADQAQVVELLAALC